MNFDTTIAVEIKGAKTWKNDNVTTKERPEKLTRPRLLNFDARSFAPLLYDKAGLFCSYSQIKRR